MEITKKEIKLIIDTFEHHESNLESEWSVELGSDEKDFLNKLKEVINYITCCDETRKVNQFLQRPSKYCMTCSKEMK
tara:strand:+ start:490 stop:720 length:231 start_codon:yes stop_codon:yes gene_type:complete